MAKRKFFTVKVILIFILSAIFVLWLPYFKGVLLGLPNNFDYQIDVATSELSYDENTDTYSGDHDLDSSISYTASGSEGNKLFIDGSFITRDSTGREIFKGNRSFAINRETFENISGYGDQNRYGYLFSPRDTTKDGFTYWHLIYDQPIEMKFKGEEDTFGLKTYHYEASFTSDVTKNLAEPSRVEDGLGVSADIELETWVEPTSGVLVEYHDELDGYVYSIDSGERLRPWGKLDSSYSFDSVVNRVNLAKDQRNIVFMVVTFIPSMLVVFITGLVVLCVSDLRKFYKWKVSNYTIMSVATVLTVSVIEVLACVTGAVAVIHLFGTSAGMHAVTSLSFILLVSMIMLSIYREESRLWRRIISSLLLFLIVISILNISGNIFGLGIVISSEIAAVSPTTSLCFLFSSIAILLHLLNQDSLLIKRFCIVMLGIVVLLGAISVFSTAYDISIFQESIWFKAMSIPTAVLFLFSSLAIWGACRWKTRERLNSVKFSSHTALLFVFLSLLIVGIAWRGSKESVNSRNVTQFESDTNKIESLIDQRLSSYINALYGVRSLFNASDNVLRSEWKAYIDGINLSDSYPGNQGIGYSLVVPASEKEAIEKSVRNEGFKDFSITPVDPVRDLYTTIIFLEPFDYRNQRAFGYDMFTESSRREAMERARDEGEAAMSGKVTLLQETSQDVQAGFLIYIPFYGSGSNSNDLTLKQRRNDLKGYVYSPIRMNDFMQAAVGDQANGISIKVYDVANIDLVNDDNLMFSSDSNTYSSSEYSKANQIEIAGHHWVIEYSSLPGYVSGVSEEFPNYVLIGGSMLSVLLGAAIFGLSSSRQRALRLAGQMTKDLKKERNNALRVKDKDDAILENINEGLILMKPDGSIERVNRAAEELLGFDEKDLLDKKYTDVLEDFDDSGSPIAQRKRPVNLALKGKGCRRVGIRCKRKDGTIFSAEVSLEPIVSGDRVIGVVEVLRDVTERRALDRAKDDFISLASHQLRTPLTANKWFLEMLIAGKVAGKLKPKQLEISKKIDMSNEHLIDLVTSLLNVTRIESGRLTINPKKTNVGELIDSVVEGLQTKSKMKHKIDVELSEKREIILDANLIRQVFMNLLTNSMKYSPSGKPIKIEGIWKKDSMLFSIKDEGYGIPKDQQKDVFSRFFRAANVTTRVPNGNGLGLYLVKKIIETSGGKIWFESVENKGTTFYFTLPSSGVKAKKGEVSLEEGGHSE